MEISIQKRNGERVPFDADKINDTLEWACQGLKNVSPSQVAMNAQIQFYDGIRTDTIQDLLVKSAANLITITNPDYQYVAGRLLMFDLRKRAFGTFDTPDFLEHVSALVLLGKYDDEILQKWSESEINYLGEYINHDKDMEYTYAAMMEWSSKYLVQDKMRGEVYESPQQAIMLIAMCLHQEERSDIRLDRVKRFYDAVSSKKISLPTPIMGGVRTPTRQFSSCTLIEAGDSLDEINAAASAIVKYASQRAGIGINGGMIRSVGSPIRGGEATHTGCIPFYKYFLSATKSCSQGGIRNGAATLFYPWWHEEVESLLVLKNNKGTEDNRIRQMDYGIQFNRLAYERLQQKGTISLFSPNVHPELYEKFFKPNNEFKELYEQLEADPLVPRKTIKATDLFVLFANERSSTGRIYLQNVDHTNSNSPFDWEKAPVKQSNLCVAPETQILTKDGNKVISELEGQIVEIYNGQEFSEVEVVKTGENQKLIEVETESGKTLACTEYHKWYLEDGSEVRTHELRVGDKLLGWNDIAIDCYTSDVICSIKDTGRVDSTYCVNEPKRHMAVFNNILTGQCLEITLPTSPLQHIHDTEGEIALCTLAAFNLEFDDDIEEMARVAVRALDNLLDYQDYPVKAAEKNKLRRTLGIGVINYAYWLAKNDLKYSDGSANEKTHELFEKIQYSVLQASNELAAEKGQCEAFGDTSYAQGVLPIDRYNKNVDILAAPNYKCDWEGLRQRIRQHGLRNSTLTALMPAETSSKISNATNGIEPVRDLMVVKGSKDSYYNQIVPHIEDVGYAYERVWDTKINKGYIGLVAIMQKFIDQSISANTNYDPRKYHGGKVSLTEVLQDILYAYKLGVKTLYYHNTRDGSGEDVGEEANCDSCTI